MTSTTKIIKMELTIDTTDFGKVIFGLAKNHPELVSGSKGLAKNHPELVSGSKLNSFKKSYNVLPRESNKILEYLSEFLKGAKIKNPKAEIKKIIVYKKTAVQHQKSGAGFTGLRVAGAIAEALSLAWEVKIKVFVKK